jgi:hypothetical protein
MSHNSNIIHDNANTSGFSIDMSNIIKKSLSSIRRPFYNSGPLEHQLTPAIQNGYRHNQLDGVDRPLDRLSDILDRLLGANGQTITPHPTPPLTTNNHHLTNRLVTFRPKNIAPGDIVRWTRSGPEFNEAQLHKAWIDIIAILCVLIVGVVSLITWRCCRNKRARRRSRRDIEAAKVEEERIAAHKEDEFEMKTTKSGRFDLWRTVSDAAKRRYAAYAHRCKPFADSIVQIPAETASRTSPSMRSSLRPASLFQFRGMTNPFADSNAIRNPIADSTPAPAEEVEMSEKIDDGMGGTFCKVESAEAKNRRLEALRVRTEAEDWLGRLERLVAERPVYGSGSGDAHTWSQ